MGWDKKKRGAKHGYYYQSVRVQGRVVKKYVGTGVLAELVALQDVRRRTADARIKTANHAERVHLTELDHAIRTACSAGCLFMRAALVLDGYHCHHGEWRRRRSNGMAKKPKLATSANESRSPASVPGVQDWRVGLRNLVDRANDGDAEALVRLRKFLDSNPWLYRQAGDLTAQAEAAWAKRIGGKDNMAIESIRRVVADLKAGLNGPHPTPLEALLVDQVAVTWMAAQDAEMQAAASTAESLSRASFRLKRAESAQKRHLAAAKTLATLRHLLPAGLIPSKPVALHNPFRTTG